LAKYTRCPAILAVSADGIGPRTHSCRVEAFALAVKVVIPSFASAKRRKLVKGSAVIDLRVYTRFIPDIGIFGEFDVGR
jgi:hypothetical protein